MGCLNFLLWPCQCSSSPRVISFILVKGLLPLYPKSNGCCCSKCHPSTGSSFQKLVLFSFCNVNIQILTIYLDFIPPFNLFTVFPNEIFIFLPHIIQFFQQILSWSSVHLHVHITTRLVLQQFHFLQRKPRPKANQPKW